MPLDVPGPIQEFLAQLDARGEPTADDLTIPVARPADGSDWPAEQQRGAYAEVVPWQFRRPNMFERRSPWGTYWAELASGTGEGGRMIYIPNADDVAPDIIDHWIARAGAVTHPNLRARYADLAWDLGKYLRKRGRQIGDAAMSAIRVPVAVAHQAIDSYLDAVQRQLAEDHMTAWQYVNRAIELSKGLSDAARVARCRAVMMALRDTVRAVDAHAGQTWRFYEIAAHHFAGEFSAAELAQILADLQAEMQVAADPSNPQRFDPHQAMNIAERLQVWGRMAGNAAVGPQAVRSAGAAFEHAAANAGGLVAVSWLEDLLPRYRGIGDNAGATRVEATIRQRATDARAELTTHSVEVEMPREEVEAIAEQVCGQSLDQALRRVVQVALIGYDKTAAQVREILADSPLVAMVTMTLTGPEGFTEAQVGGIEEDEEGRTVHHAAQVMNWHAGMLDLLFRRIRERYGPTAAQLADYVHGCPLFRAERRPLVERGLQAWLDGDAIVAAHLLVPQIEAALRVLCVDAGGSVMKPDDRYNGFRVDGMGTVLDETHLCAVMPPDIRFHLAALFTDPRGLSVRNHLAHGMALPEGLGIGLCNWIVHAVLAVALFRKRADSAPAEQDQSAT